MEVAEDEMKVPVEKIWGKYRQRQQTSDPIPWWGAREPQFRDIQKAIDEERFQPQSNDQNQHLGDYLWHVERIAHLVKHPNEITPICLKHDGDIANGAHRIIAARFLGKVEIDAVIKKDVVST